MTEVLVVFIITSDLPFSYSVFIYTYICLEFRNTSYISFWLHFVAPTSRGRCRRNLDLLGTKFGVTVLWIAITLLHFSLVFFYLIAYTFSYVKNNKNSLFWRDISFFSHTKTKHSLSYNMVCPCVLGTKFKVQFIHVHWLSLAKTTSKAFRFIQSFDNMLVIKQINKQNLIHIWEK